MSSVHDRVWALIEPYVAAIGVELDDLEILHGGQMIRVTLDTPDENSGPPGVDVIAELSSGIGRILDAEDPIEGSYTLEVSSPGLERKLRRKAHYDKSIGRIVKIKTDTPVDGEKTHTGLLVSVDDDSFVVDVDGSHREITYAEVSVARTVFVWEQPGQKTQHA